MRLRRGGIYLANSNPSKGSEPGKIRPCLVMQSDLLNEADHPSTIVLPLTTRLIDDAAPLRFRIARRDRLREDSDVMVDQVRTLDNRRFQGERLAELSGAELAQLEIYWSIVLGLDV
ncbi:type II toxin-antitoxin system PemK/MazF family toxin [Lentisalinibacter sediminis]|uniref:type II toxin-antitoxin system PemK/MazF family toxin n=1 Tax=Lentisalinibacter sediminis TaxID=2992237 RepID=UPI003864F82B